jgi:hypothetical protein
LYTVRWNAFLGCFLLLPPVKIGLEIKDKTAPAVAKIWNIFHSTVGTLHCHCTSVLCQLNHSPRQEEVKIRVLMDFISKIVFTLKQKPASHSQAACLLPGGLEGKRTLEIEKKKKWKKKKKAN